MNLISDFKNSFNSLQITAFIGLLFGSLHLIAQSTFVTEQKPNFIVVLVDDLGYGDIGAYRELYQGKDKKSIAYLYTPQLDKLADEGIVCSRAYSSSWCAPSRQMLLSGCWINRKGVRDQHFPWVGRRLRQEGYTTGMYGKSHGKFANFRNTRYFDDDFREFDQGLFFRGGMRGYHLKKGEILPGHIYQDDASYQAKGNEYITDIFTKGATDFIKRNADKPFFLYLAYNAPHSPLQAKPDDLRYLFPEEFGSLSDSIIRAAKKPKGMLPNWNKYHYAAMVYAIDRGLGQIKQALNEAGIADNTIIVFTSDNGAIQGSNYPLTGHKWDVYEGGIRVPFIVWSDKISKSNNKGSVYDGLVSTVDIAPTLMALAGNNNSEDFDGKNIMPYITGLEEAPLESQIFYYRETLAHHQVTGSELLYPMIDKRTPLLLEAFIQKDKKYLSFRGLKGLKVIEGGMVLPDVRNISEPSKRLIEDVQGITSSKETLLSKEEFVDLKRNHQKFIEQNKLDFILRWSGPEHD